MNILILGADGYIGTPLMTYLNRQGHYAIGVDNLLKRRLQTVLHVNPLVDIPAKDKVGLNYCESECVIDPDVLYEIVVKENPDAIIHLAEQPSAPFSMRNAKSAIVTQENNVITTLSLIYAVRRFQEEHGGKTIHIVKLGTMGEYGTPNIPIEEGWLDVEHKGCRDRILYPKRPGSWYHASKVHDSVNLELACRLWDFKVTDINQGPVYGVNTVGGQIGTSFNYDPYFGTVLNRFMVQAIARYPLTVYGGGGQIRGYINLLDTMQALHLVCQNPPAAGEFRVFNQITELFSVEDLAMRVIEAAKELGIGAVIKHCSNPRVEAEGHMYDVCYTGLTKIGFVPHLLTQDILVHMLHIIKFYESNINPGFLGIHGGWK